VRSFPGVRGDVRYRRWLVDAPVATCVFLHGFGEHSDMYQRFAVSLNDAGIDLWASDQIGHGHSEGQRGQFGSLDDLVEDARRLRRIATARSPYLPLVLGGYELGGLAAALAIARAPDRYHAAVLAGTPLSPLEWVHQLARSGAPELALDRSDLSSDPWYTGALERDPLAFTRANAAPAVAASFPPAWRELDRTLERAGIPLLLVHGTDDPLAPVEDARTWAARLPDASLAEFAGAKHAVLNETGFRSVSAAIVEFVQRVTALSRIDPGVPGLSRATSTGAPAAQRVA
jgi:alpha-beta hydrolase superfamily lysophospholipase